MVSVRKCRYAGNGIA